MSMFFCFSARLLPEKLHLRDNYCKANFADLFTLLIEKQPVIEHCFTSLDPLKASTRLDVRMPTVVEKPKISRPMWNSLKSHILRERQRKKLEQEADAEVERQRREREDQQKEQEMTLEETREQVAQCEARLAQLKEDKHQLFLQLKKVLHEDESRKKIKESNNNGDLTFLHGYPAPGSMANTGVPLISGAPGFLQTPGQNKQLFGSSKEESGGAIKHSRSPSPTHLPYVPYKTHALSYSSGSISQPYGSSSVGAAVYYNQLASSSASITGQGSFQFPSNAVYAYPAQYAPGARNHFPIQSGNLSKEELVKHSSSFVTLGSSQIPPRAGLNSRTSTGSSGQGYLHPSQEHGTLVKPATNMFPSVEQERFYLPQNVSGSLVGSSNSPGSGLRSHSSSLNGSSVSAPSHSVSSGVQQSASAAKNGPNVGSSRPPSSSAYLQTVNPSHMGTTGLFRPYPEN